MKRYLKKLDFLGGVGILSVGTDGEIGGGGFTT